MCSPLVASACGLASPCRIVAVSSLRICIAFWGLLNCDCLWPQGRLEKLRGCCHVDQLASALKKQTCHLNIARTSPLLPSPSLTPHPQPSPDTHCAMGSAVRMVLESEGPSQSSWMPVREEVVSSAPLRLPQGFWKFVIPFILHKKHKGNTESHKTSPLAIP